MAIASMTNETVDNSIAGFNARSGVSGNSTSDDISKSFLTLLVAQLKNQDPTNPMQNNELTTQLAQISTVSGIEKLNSTVGSLLGQINDSQSIQASGLIGHGVMVPGKDLLVGKTEDGKAEPQAYGVELERAAEKVTVTITDATGKVVRTIEHGPLSSGVYAFSWDGLGEEGSAVPDGAYTVSVNAQGKEGQQLVAQPLKFAIVYAVTRGPDGAKLDLGLAGGMARLDDVRLIFPKLDTINTPEEPPQVTPQTREASPQLTPQQKYR